ncbi:EAL domain-containing protein [Pseudoalteromonas sp. OOF1S-7]|uniref:EAL domain-containing protein n=1 Tax=Pseudoalteromonas sp. OOF1S-7 TaxID=2917757 RepID=UPI001EF5E741|nr:EAL domain-containing protein [Pseudoalteromonas sp. OOF1S-7]MCG7536610.1 EAL domain-containing protein [Pseudoalteromonas sp. OOF1S-7]
MRTLTLVSLSGWPGIIKRVGQPTAQKVWRALVALSSQNAQAGLRQDIFELGELWFDTEQFGSPAQAQRALSQNVAQHLLSELDCQLVLEAEIQVSSAPMTEQVSQEQSIRSDAACALNALYPDSKEELLRVFANKSLLPYWQSIQLVQSEGVFGYEALIRGPKASPLHRADKLFGAAMAQGRQFDMEKLALSTHLATHQHHCEHHGSQQRLTVNLSPGLLFDVDVSDTLQHYPYAHLLCIELTEHLPVDNWAPVKAKMAELRQLGYTFWLDDVGCGFFELTVINTVKPDVVKLCITIISRLDYGAEIIDEIRQVVDTVHLYGGKVLAEGIETPQQLNIAKALGVDYAQGYLFDKPREAGL